MVTFWIVKCVISIIFAVYYPMTVCVVYVRVVPFPGKREDTTLRGRAAAVRGFVYVRSP